MRVSIPRENSAKFLDSSRERLFELLGRNCRRRRRCISPSSASVLQGVDPIESGGGAKRALDSLVCSRCTEERTERIPAGWLKPSPSGKVPRESMPAIGPRRVLGHEWLDSCLIATGAESISPFFPVVIPDTRGKTRRRQRPSISFRIINAPAVPGHARRTPAEKFDRRYREELINVAGVR